jgi:hypothetical protein
MSEEIPDDDYCDPEMERVHGAAPGIPDWVLPAYGAGILSGLLGYMMLQPGQSYSNQAMAQSHPRPNRDSQSATGWPP